MDLASYLIQSCAKMGPIRWTRMFGWTCAIIGRNFFGGYQALDDNVVILFLVLSPKGYEKAIASGQFEKFEFGQTWAEVELNREEEIDQIWPFIEDAFNYSKIRKQKSKKKPRRLRQ